jgi:hypothetical protein
MTRFLTLLAALCLIGFSACEKSPNEADNPTNTECYAKKVEGPYSQIEEGKYQTSASGTINPTWSPLNIPDSNPIATGTACNTVRFDIGSDTLSMECTADASGNLITGASGNSEFTYNISTERLELTLVTSGGTTYVVKAKK